MADMEAEKSAPKPCGLAAHAVLEGGMAEAVVGRALLRVLQRLVGFVDFLEARLGGLVAVAAIGMTLLGETAKGSLDLLIAGASRNT